MTDTDLAYYRPESLADAWSAWQEAGGRGRWLAGGHSLLPMMKLALAKPEALIDLSRIPELGDITDEGRELRLGAMARHYDVAHSPLVLGYAPLLSLAAAVIGDMQVRRRGTLGGSLAHADPAADMPAAVLALAAEMEVASPRGHRRIPAQQFFRGPMTTALADDELLTAVWVAKQSPKGSAYVKMPHPASGYAVVGVAVSLDWEDENVARAGIGVTGVADTPFRATKAESMLVGRPLTDELILEASQSAAPDVEYLGDVYASAEYRRHLTAVYIGRALRAARAHR